MKRSLNRARLLAPVVALVCLFTAGPSVNAVTITTADGNGADTFVEGVPSNENYGTRGNIVLKNPSGPTQFARKGYIRFDLSSMAGRAALDATLSLTVENNNLVSGNFTVDVFALNDGAGDFWIEGNGGTDNSPTGEINWDNAPGNDVTSGINLDGAEVTSLGSFNVENSGTDGVGSILTFSLASLTAAINADNNEALTLILRRSGTNDGNSPNLAFASKENTSNLNHAPPTLDITLAPIPEPATATLALVGLGGLVMRRRRNMA